MEDSYSFWVDFLKGMLKPVAATCVVLMAVALSFCQNLGLEKEMIFSIARAFLQLSVIGFVLQFIFSQKNIAWILLAYLFMVAVAGYTAGQRAKHVPRGKYVAGASILAGTAVTMSLLVLLRVFPFTPRYIIPVAGMMVGNAMTVTGGDSTGTWCDATAGDTSAGEEGSDHRALPCPGQCEDGGPHLSSWCDDRPYNGRCFSFGSHSVADSCDEHAYRGGHCQQHHVDVPLLARLLHQSLPVGAQGPGRLSS